MPWLKGTAALAAVACAVLAGAGPGKAQPEAPARVVLLDDPAGRPRESLVQALRIQLSGLSRLEAIALEPGADPREQAGRLAREPSTLAVLWPSGSDSAASAGAPGDASAMHALALTESGLREELVRVPGGPRSDVERSLALKVRELVHALRRERAATGQDEASSGSEPSAAASPAPALGLAFLLGARVAPLSERAQWGGLFAGGAGWRSSALRVVGALELAWYPELELASGTARARVSELAPGLFARAELRQGATWLGAHGGLSLSFVHAEGRDARERGEASERLASALGGVHVELEIAEGFGLYAGLDLQLRLRRQRFTVGGVQLVDFGRLRPAATLALAWSWPVAR